jgi:hypothetical protein
MRSRPEALFDDACAIVESVLDGPARREIAAELSASQPLAVALQRLRQFMRANACDAAGHRFNLERAVNALDRATRQEGFHVLNDWDGRSDRVNEESIPVDVLDYIVRMRGDDAADATVVAILIDYYFVHLLELMSLRIWDGGDADANLDRIAALLALLQGEHGSGQPFTADAETLMLMATSHYERREFGYRLLLDRVRSLDRRHQLGIALGHAASMGSHLRFGFEASYARDTVFMRDDNVADYPWLCYALLTLMREYSRSCEAADAASSDRVVEALLNGLSPDARAFIGAPPAILSSCERERAEFAELFRAHQADLLERFEPLRPTEEWYSPLAFFFNFSHNVRKGTVVDALLRGQPWRLTFNDLLTALPKEESASRAKERLATTLMTYARLNPDRIRGRLMPVIVYDPLAGRQAFGTTMRRIRNPQ